MTRQLALLVIAAVMGAPASLAAPPTSKVSKDLQGVRPNDIVDIVIQYSVVPSDKHKKTVHDNGGQEKGQFPFIKASGYRIPAQALNALVQDPDVMYISADRRLSGFLNNAAAAVNAPAAWQQGYTGTGIGVAVIDSGINPVDLDTRVIYTQAFGGLTDGSDQFGHGSHVAGIIGNSGAASNGFYKGIAPNVKIINLRVLDQNGSGQDSAVIAAIQTAIQLKTTYNIRVINLSLGRPVFESYTMDPLCQAVEAAWNAGIVVVTAAGNSGRDNTYGTNGYATIQAPANDPYAITVGAMKTMGTPGRSDDLVASYSSKGPTLYDHVVKPDLVAPGNVMTSTLQKNTSLYGLFPGNQVYLSSYTGANNTNASSVFYKLSGTSMAAPVVSGAAALLLQQNPQLTPDQVKARLMKTATKNFPTQSAATDPNTGITYVSQYDIFTIGAGYLDIAAALANTDLAAASAKSPAVSFDSASGNTYLVLGSTVVWGTTIVWGTAAVWGTAEVWGTSAVWGTAAVWGTSTSTGFGVVWGDTVVWGTSSSSQALSAAIAGEQ
jgi:serine protease AprX